VVGAKPSLKAKLGGKMHQAVAQPAGGCIETGVSGSNGSDLGFQTPSSARNFAAAPMEHDGSGSEDEWEPGAYGLIDAQQKPRGFGGSRPAAGGRQEQQQRRQQAQPVAQGLPRPPRPFPAASLGAGSISSRMPLQVAVWQQSLSRPSPFAFPFAQSQQLAGSAPPSPRLQAGSAPSSPCFLSGQQRVQRSGGSGASNLRRGASGGQQRQEEIDRLESDAFGSEFAAPL
jgi:hypothetical protein